MGEVERRQDFGVVAAKPGAGQGGREGDRALGFGGLAREFGGEDAFGIDWQASLGRRLQSSAQCAAVDQRGGERADDQGVAAPGQVA
ncbi:MAG: hypothetical protein WDM85_06900 [Caulobacteraceae bacterium]